MPNSNEQHKGPDPVLVWIVVLLVIIVAGVVIWTLSGGGRTAEPASQTPTETGVAGTITTATSMNTAQSGAPSIEESVAPTENVRRFTVNGRNFSFTPETLRVKKGDMVSMTFVSSEGIHDLRIDGYNIGTDQLSQGNAQSVTFAANTAGTFEFYCSVGNHREMGMKGTLIVE